MQTTKADVRFMILMAIMMISVLSLFVYISSFKKDIESELFSLSTDNIASVSSSYINKINFRYSDSGLKELLLSDSGFRAYIDDHLNTFIAGNIKYVFIVYRDDAGVYRFAADGSAGNDKAETGEKLDVYSPKWDMAYNTGEPQYIIHENLKTLGITYLYPSKHEGVVDSLLAVDFSVENVLTVRKLISVIEKGLLTLFGIIVFMSIIYVFFDLRYRRFRKTSQIDPLTGLYNRSFLNNKSISFYKYAFCFIDIDFFKNINDTYGHEVGDVVLRELGRRLRETYRTGEDILIRYGGEEFLMLIPKEGKSDKSLKNIIVRALKVVEDEPFLAGGHKLHITISMGVNIHPEKAKDFDEAVKFADTALYAAKEDGRNRAVFFDGQ